MNDLRLKLEAFNIEWDGPMIILTNDRVTILSPFQIIDRITSVSSSVQRNIYSTLCNIKTRRQMILILENIARNLLAIRC
ncbi:MAG: hypothetical protein H6599_00370 [Flavobacteriales bacterium]|nr:hypothetical protein [Flavobacteriales bacterium]